VIDRVAAVEGMVSRIRDHYVDQFRDFVARQRKLCVSGGAEVKFEISDDPSAFHRMAVVDFVRNDDGPEGVLFEPENVLTFETMEGQVSNTELTIESLRWDSVAIIHDVPRIEDAIESWFIKWFDPDEVRFDEKAEFSNCIHAVYVSTNELQVDLGTAPADAFWELLDGLSDGNATSIRVSS
jgi:hypothetical protein